jgi:hypothetical protein
MGASALNLRLRQEAYPCIDVLFLREILGKGRKYLSVRNTLAYYEKSVEVLNVQAVGLYVTFLLKHKLPLEGVGGPENKDWFLIKAS